MNDVARGYARVNSQAVFNWDDLKHLLAVARTGTTLGAARELGTSQPTVVRRIAALEEATGVNLFDRGHSGYALTEAGRQILPLAQRVNADVLALADALTARRRSAPGVIRLTVPELLNDLIFPALCAFQRDFPKVQVQLLLADRRLDLARGEADVALRAGDAPDAENLYVRRMPDGGWTAYVSQGYAATAGVPRTPAELNRHVLIAGEGSVDQLLPMKWLAREAPGAVVAWRCNSLTNVQAAIRAGLGVSMLPCCAGGSDPELVACFSPPEEITRPVWLITRRELARLPHVRALLEAITLHMQAHEVLLAGNAP